MELEDLVRIPGYARALYAIRCLSEDEQLQADPWREDCNTGCIGVSIEEVTAAMNESKPQKIPDFDTEVAYVICRSLTGAGALKELQSPMRGKPKLFVMLPSAPRLELSDVPLSMVARGRDVEAPRRNGSVKPSEKRAVRQADRLKPTHVPAPVPRPAPLSTRPASSVKPRAVKVTKDEGVQPSRNVKAKTVAPNVPPPLADPPALEKKSERRIYSRDEVLELLRRVKPDGWFTGDEDWLPEDINRGRFRITCSNLSKGAHPVLKRQAVKRGSNYIYQFHLL